MHTFSSKNRQSILDKIETTSFDLLVIGGGITGVGILLDAQSRGLKTALVEMQDFASGTSSRSTKLIHGGLRYLKQLELRLVAEVGKERAIVFKNGRHVTRAEEMILPIYKKGSLGYFPAYFGLWLYDFLAGVKAPEKRKMLSTKKLSILEPLLKKENLTGGALYYEYRTDDARLTIEILKKAVELGAVACNYLQVRNFIYENGKIIGVEMIDVQSGRSFHSKSTFVVNATGPWVDTLDVKNDPKKGDKLFLTKGVHIVLNRKNLPIKHSVYFDTPDQRMIFAIPRGDKVYAGTTDTVYSGDLSNPLISSEDRDYILGSLNNIFDGVNLNSLHVESSWAGLRPLIKENGKSPSAVSRKDEIFEYPSGLITIAGGKLTGYRKMAERIVDLVFRKFISKKSNQDFVPCKTKEIKISGGDFDSQQNFESYRTSVITKCLGAGMSKEEASMAFDMYGSNSFDFLKIYENAKNDAMETLPTFLKALILYSIENESTLTLSDFFIRRTGALYFNISWVRQWKEAAADFMAVMLDWTEGQKNKNMAELKEAVYHAAG